MTNRTKALLALLGNAAIWGLAFPLAKKGFDQTGPMTFLFYRYLFAVLAGLPIIIVFWKKLKFKLKNLPEIFLIGILGNVIGHTLLYLGLDKTSALEASLLTVLVPILISIGGAFFLAETITKKEKIGTFIAFLGSIIIVLEPLWFNSQKLSTVHALGNLLIIGYNFAWAITVLWMKKAANKYHPFALCYGFFVVSLFCFLPLAIVENPLVFSQNYASLKYAFTASLYMGTLGSLAAFYLYQYGQKYIEASEASLFTYLTAIFTAPIAIFWLKEKISLPFITGGVVVVIGIIIAESRKQRVTE